MHTKRQKAAVLLPYTLIFFAVWAIYHFFADPWLTTHISSGWLCTLVTEGLLKNLIWTLPAFCLLKKFAADALSLIHI